MALLLTHLAYYQDGLSLPEFRDALGHLLGMGPNARKEHYQEWLELSRHEMEAGGRGGVGGGGGRIWWLDLSQHEMEAGGRGRGGYLMGLCLGVCVCGGGMVGRFSVHGGICVLALYASQSSSLLGPRCPSPITCR